MSSQEHTVAVLRRTLTSTNVSYVCICFMLIILMYSVKASTYAILRSSRNRKDVHDPSPVASALRVSLAFAPFQLSLLPTKLKVQITSVLVSSNSTLQTNVVSPSFVKRSRTSPARRLVRKLWLRMANRIRVHPIRSLSLMRPIL